MPLLPTDWVTWFCIPCPLSLPKFSEYDFALHFCCQIVPKTLKLSSLLNARNLYNAGKTSEGVLSRAAKPAQRLVCIIYLRKDNSAN